MSFELTFPNLGDYSFRSRQPPYPLSALVGQEPMRLALLLNAIYPEVGGVLLYGQKGSAKSTAARALAALLPPTLVVDGCPLRCDPAAPYGGCPRCASLTPPLPVLEVLTSLVELPLGASEDRVLGSIQLERTVQTGRRHFETGLLALAHRGILYIDEVNLLPDHLVDLLLDVAAMGVNTIEREGVSFSHPARFLLIGTMNPEEGELRPQFIDRFGLSVEVSARLSPEERVEVVRRRMAYERDAAGFAAQWASKEQDERERVERARLLLPEVRLDDRLLLLIAQLCLSAGVEGLRADLVIHRAARALAAYEGRLAVSEDDLRRAAALALPHRRRRKPFEPQGLDSDVLDQLFEQARRATPPDQGPAPAPSQGAGAARQPEPEPGQPEGQRDESDLEQQSAAGDTSSTGPQPGAQAGGEAAPRVFEIGGTPALALPATRAGARTPGGARRRGSGAAPRGRARGATPSASQPAPLALDATLLAAAPHQARRRGTGRGIELRPEDLRLRRRTGAAGRLIIFLVDSSGSMGAQQRMAAVKGAILALLQDAYCQRDQVALVTFRGQGAELALPPTRSVEQAERRLAALPTGGRTPLAHGLQRALDLLRQARRGADPREPLLVLLSDGRANVSLGGGEPLSEALELAAQCRDITALVVDSENGYPRLGLARRISQALGAQYVQLAALEGQQLYATVRQTLGGPERQL